MIRRPRPVGSDPRIIRSRWQIRSAALCTLEPLEARKLLSAVNVTGFHNDLQGTGANLNETTLTPANVNQTTFGKQYSTAVDGQIYAEPLYMTGVNVTAGTQQGVHNVVYVETEHDSLYAIDADSGQVLWQESFLVPEAGLSGVTSVTTVSSSDVNTSDITPEIGITGTPIIDPATGQMFFMAKTKQIVNNNTAAPHFVETLYKVNIQDGTYVSTVIGDTIDQNGNFTYRTTGTQTDPYVVGTGDGAITVGGQSRVYFNALRVPNRPGLTMLNGNVYIAFASHGDNDPYHGWVLGFNESTLALTAALNTTPNGSRGGIWQGGGRVVVDPQGFLYFETGNGTFDENLNAQSFPGQGDYGDSFVKLTVDPATGPTNQNINGWGLKVVDYFTPLNESQLESADEDLGSGGPIVLPDSVGTAATPHLLVGAGKEGKVYLINRDNMGKFSPSTDNVVQELSGLGGVGSFDAPSFFFDGTSSRIYYVPGQSTLKSIKITNGTMTFDSASTDTYASRTGSGSVSANGTTNGIVWAINPANNGGTPTLRAYNASNVSQELWTSQQNATRDSLGGATKFSTPTISNGQVFVGTSNALVAYGVIAAPKNPPAAPTNLNATPVSSVQINLSWQENDASAAGFNVEESTDGGATFNQIAMTGSGVTNYSVIGLTAGTTYSFRVRAFNAKGDSGYSNTATATTGHQAPGLDFSSGFAGAAGLLTLNGSAQVSGSNLELTDGGGTEAGSAFSTTTLPVQRFNTTFKFQLTNAQADGFTFTIQGQGPTALGGTGGGLGYANDAGGGGIPTSIAVKFDLYNNAGEGSDSTGLFADGDSPTVPVAGDNPVDASVDLTSTGIDLHSGDVMQVALNYDGTTLQETITDTATNATFTTNYTVNIPAIVGANGAYVGFTGGTGGATAVQDILSWTYTPTPAPPATPTNLTVTPASGTELDVSWSEPAGSSVDHFTILRKGPTDTTFTQLAQVPGTQTTYVNTGLTQNTTYSYEVIASNAGGDSAAAGPVSGTTPNAPAAPTNLMASNITTTSVTLTWQDNANNETGYRVSRQLASNNSQLVATLQANSTTFTDTGLSSGSPYEYVVAAFNLAGPSAGDAVSFQTLASAPTGVQANGGGNSVNLNWSASTGASSYNIYRGTVAGGEASTPVASHVTGVSFADTGLTAGQTYYYVVTAVDGGGEGPRSTEVSANAFLPGDADGDGKVDFADFVIVARDFGRTNAIWSTGDFNGDGKVGFDDFVIVARNYGQSVSAAATNAAAQSPALTIGAATANTSSTSQLFSQKRIKASRPNHLVV